MGEVTEGGGGEKGRSGVRGRDPTVLFASPCTPAGQCGTEKGQEMPIVL